MSVIPGYQTPLSGYQIAGQAFKEGSGVIDKMAALIEKRKQNLIQQRNDQIEAERKAELRRREDEAYKRAQEELKRWDEFRDWAGKGKEENIPYEPEEILQEGVRRMVYDPLEYAKSQAKNSQSAIARMQKYPGKDGYMKVFNPLKGTSTDMINETTGEKVENQEYFRYYETDDGVVPLSTTRPPTEKPKPIQGLTPAGKEKQELQTSKLELEIDNLKKAQDMARQGGQHKATQYSSAGYGLRIEESSKQIDDLLKRTDFDPTTMARALESTAPSYFQSSEMQELRQAMRNFINAGLRDESGAAIAPSEFENATKQYFPMAGDSPQVLEQKRKNRLQKLAQFQAEAGGAWDEVKTKYQEVLGGEGGKKNRRKATASDF